MSRLTYFFAEAVSIIRVDPEGLFVINQLAMVHEVR